MWVVFVFGYILGEGKTRNALIKKFPKIGNKSLVEKGKYH